MKNNNINNNKSNITHHIFVIDEAIKYGIEKAIILYNLRYWLEHNKANGKHIHEYDGDDERYKGRTFVWTYNSSTAFEKLFPYMKARSIRRWLNELEQDGVIVSSSSYNQHQYDKTKWYSIVDEFEIKDDKPSGQNGQSIGQNDRSIGQNDRTIPNINTNINKNIDQSKIDQLFDEFWQKYPRKVSKKKSKEIFTRLFKKTKNPDKLFKEIISGLERYKKTDQWNRDNGRFIPHPSTWLNQERWTDEVSYNNHEIKSNEIEQRIADIKKKSFNEIIRFDKHHILKDGVLYKLGVEVDKDTNKAKYKWIMDEDQDLRRFI